MAKRTSLTLEPLEESAVEAFTTESSPERAALESLSAVSLSSEAAVLRALIRIGADTVRDQILADGYQAMAIEFRQDEPERKSLRARRVERDAGRE